MKKDRISVDELLQVIPNKYELTILAGRAARKEFVEGVEKYKILDNVFEEILEGKVKIVEND